MVDIRAGTQSQSHPRGCPLARYPETSGYKVLFSMAARPSNVILCANPDTELELLAKEYPQ